MKRSLMVEGRGIPPGRVLAPANRHDSPLLAPSLDRLDDIGPLPEDITITSTISSPQQPDHAHLNQRTVCSRSSTSTGPALNPAKE
jgi:hypothetical protein